MVRSEHHTADDTSIIRLDDLPERGAQGLPTPLGEAALETT
jgi:hypothetical protein